LTTTRESAEKYKYPSFAMETAFEYKYQIAMETAERNTSKQVSTKETALQNMYKYSRIIIIFFYLKQSDCKETKSRKWIEGISGS